MALARSTPDPRAGTAPVRSGSLSRNEMGRPAGSPNSRQRLSILPPNSLTLKNIELFSCFFFLSDIGCPQGGVWVFSLVRLNEV